MVARWTLGTMLMAAVMFVPASALATHMSSYMFYPTEHDDLGRSFEPDFQSTGVLGTVVANCIVSFDLQPGCVPDTALPPAGGQSALLAPGCTDDAGRQPSGLCGLFTAGAGTGTSGTVVPPGIVGIQGMSGSAAPGRFTPDKSRVIRFLDSQVQYQNVPPAGGSTYLEYNAKLRDAGVSDTLAGLDGNLGGDAILPGGSALWAWYGNWVDKNGNGVVDHLASTPECTTSSCPPSGGVTENNEFVWIGRCIQFNGQAAPPGQKYCNFEPDSTMPVWIYPGNHHAFCGFGVNVPTAGTLPCGITPGDAPGRQFILFAIYTNCPGTTCLVELDDADNQFYGDPVFGDQDDKGVDMDGNFAGIWGMGDRTGEYLASGRQWVHGLGWATWFYDQSLVVNTVVVTGVTHEGPVEDLDTDFDLSKLLMSDVDSYRSWSPVVEDLLLSTVKPAARSSWLTAREVAAAENATGEAGRLLPGTRLTYDECDPYLGIPCPSATSSAQTQGHLFDRIFDPGWAKEPNTDADVYPGAVRGVCADAFESHQGQCNTYAGYAAGPRAWVDLTSFPAYYGQLAWRTPLGNCVTCVTSGPSGLPNLPAGYLRNEDDFRRVLQPGSHVFGAGYGAWTDLLQFHEEETLDLLATLAALEPTYRTESYVVAPDGWRGDIVNTTGFSRVGGFLPEECTIRGVTAVYEYAQCHPYGDGNRDYSDNGGAGEFTGGEKFGGEGLQGHWLLRLTPADGCWSVPVFVWRSFDTWTIGDTGAINDFTGQCATITMDMGEGPGLGTKDLLILPQGNMGESVVSELAGVVTAKDQGVVIVEEYVRDVDVYGPYAG